MQNVYLRGLLLFLIGGIVASLAVVAIKSRPKAQTMAPAVKVASAPVPKPAPRPAETARAEPPPPPSEQTAAPERTEPEQASQSPRSSSPTPAKKKVVTEPEPEAQPAPRPEPPIGPMCQGPCATSSPSPTSVMIAPPQGSAPDRESARARNRVVLGPGTPLVIRLDESISSQRNKAGQTFSGVLEQPVAVDGVVAAQRGARVEGRVVQAKRASRFSGLARLSVVLTKMTTANGEQIPIKTYPVEMEGPNIVGVQALKNGASNGVGTVVGAVAGHQAGSAIGSLTGGIIGTSGAILTGGKPAVLSTQQPVSFRLLDPITVTE